MKTSLFKRKPDYESAASEYGSAGKFFLRHCFVGASRPFVDRVVSFSDLLQSRQGPKEGDRVLEEVGRMLRAAQLVVQRWQVSQRTPKVHEI